MINAYEPLLVETDGGMVCRDCVTFCTFGTTIAPCQVDGCECERCGDRLTAVAAAMKRERDGKPRDLTAERFGRPTRGAA